MLLRGLRSGGAAAPPHQSQRDSIYQPDIAQLLLQFLQPHTAVFHLSAVAFKTDGTVCRDFQGALQDFPVAGAEGDAVGDRDLDLIPILRPVFLQVLVWPSHEIIAALQLRPADEDAAVGIRRRAEFQPENEIVGEGLSGPDHLDQPRRSRMHGQNSVSGRVASVVARGLAVKIVCPVTPARQVVPVKQADKALLRFEIIGGDERCDGRDDNQGSQRKADQAVHARIIQNSGRDCNCQTNGSTAPEWTKLRSGGACARLDFVLQRFRPGWS